MPFFLETAGADGGAFPTRTSTCAALRSLVGRRSGSGVLLGEVNLPYDQQLEFFGGTDGDELTMQFDFIGMQALYLALARADAGPLATALERRPALHPDSQWATFVRNHDELTLDKLSDDERAEVFAAFGPEETMQVYGRGLRRRLPPMLDGDPRRIRMVYSLLFSLPGTPVLFYGEEIGMGEDLDAEGRLAVRTPMQWTVRAQRRLLAAPSRASCPARWSAAGSRPSTSTSPDQRNDPDSLLSFMKLLIRRYRESPGARLGRLHGARAAVPRGAGAPVHAGTTARSSALHNLGAEPRTVPLTLEGCDSSHRLVDLLQPGETTVSDKGAVEIALERLRLPLAAGGRRGQPPLV